MYDFVLNMWIMKRIDETKIRSYVAKGFIAQADADMILATPQKD